MTVPHSKTLAVAAASTPARLSTPTQVAAAWLLSYSGRTREAYACDLRQFAGWLEEAGVEPFAVERVHLEAYVRHLELAGRSRATVARKLSALASFYTYAADEGLISRPPTARVRRPALADDSQALGLDRDELRAFIAAARAGSSRDLALALLLAMNGLRISEALGADLEDLGWERGHRTLRVVRKRGRRALVPLAPVTAAALDAYIGERAAGPLFATSSGRRMDRHAARKAIRRLARAADIGKPIGPHSLRHTFVTTALDAGVPLRDVQDAAGHRSPATTRRYDRGRNSLDRHATYAVAARVN